MNVHPQRDRANARCPHGRIGTAYELYVIFTRRTNLESVTLDNLAADGAELGSGVGEDYQAW